MLTSEVARCRAYNHPDTMIRRLANALRKRAEANALMQSYLRGRRYGKLHADPGHFYSPIPSLEDVRAREAKIFAVPPEIAGVDLRAEAQLALLDELAPFCREYPFPREREQQFRYHWSNGFYERVDSMMLFALMRHLRPARVIEIGCGFSSAVMLDTNEFYLGGETSLTFIDPYPERLKGIVRPSDTIELHQVDVRDADPSLLIDLSPGDILFIDTSHVTKVTSDVNYLFFEILPQLSDGVWVHIHDVFYPFEYPREWVLEGWAWNEAYLVRAFLQYNDAFEVMLFNNYLRRQHPDRLLPLLPSDWRDADWELGSGIWLRKGVSQAETDHHSIAP